MEIHFITHFLRNYYRWPNSWRNCFIFLSILHFLLIIFLFVNLLPSYASTKSSTDGALSIDIKQLPLNKVCEQILKETENEIIFPQKYQEKIITLKLYNEDLTTVLKRVIKLAGIKNYAIVQNNHQIKILSFETATSNNQELNAENALEDEHRKYGLETYLMPETSATDIGPGLTFAESEALKKLNEAKVKSIPKNMIVTPPTDSGEGLTVDQLNELKKAQKKEMESIPDDTIVTPPTDSGEGLTMGQLKTLKETYNKKTESIPGDTIVTPPTDSGEGLTMDELKALKESSN